MKFDRVLVTGGAGFIGSHLVRELVRRGYEVDVLDSLSSGRLDRIKDLLADSRISFICGDIRDVQTVRKASDGVDAVVHLAAIKDVQFSTQNPSLTYEINTVGTRNLLDACVSSGVRKFLFVSTSAVYGNARYLPIDEGHPLDPLSAYADSKIRSEMECINSDSRRELETLVFRLFNVYGPEQGTDSHSGVIMKFMERIQSRKSLIIYGDGNQTRDFVNVKVVVTAIALTLEMDAVEDRIFNIGSGRAISILDLAAMLSELFRENDIGVIHEATRTGEVLQSQTDIERARNDLRLNPSIDLRSGLEELVNRNA